MHLLRQIGAGVRRLVAAPGSVAWLEVLRRVVDEVASVPGSTRVMLESVEEAEPMADLVDRHIGLQGLVWSVG